MNSAGPGSEPFPEKVLLSWEFKTYQREIKLLWIIYSKIILWLRFMTWSYTAHHKFISRSLGFMSALHPHHTIMRFSLTHHNLFLIIHYFSRASCLRRIYLFIFHAKLVTALMLPPLQFNPVIMWFGKMGGSVFRISWFQKNPTKPLFPPEDSAIHHCTLCSYSLFSASISPE